MFFAFLNLFVHCFPCSCSGLFPVCYLRSTSSFSAVSKRFSCRQSVLHSNQKQLSKIASAIAFVTPMSSPIIRRSTRHSKPSARAKLLLEQKLDERSVFPVERDEICVKWSLNDAIIWWPATVRSVTSKRNTNGEVHANIVYSKFGDYDAEEASVVFSSSSPKERYVRTVNDTQAENIASWIFADEPNNLEGEEGDESGDDESRNDVNPNNANSSSSLSTVIRPSSSTTRKPVRSNLRSEFTHPRQSAIFKVTRNRLSRRSAEGQRNKRLSSGSASNEEHAELLTRLRLVESQLVNVRNVNLPMPSSSLSSVLVSLRWALLRTLEKPLKMFPLPDLGKHGLACHELTVTAQCDYYTFRELAKMLAEEHRVTDDYNQDRREGSRIAFSPSYNTTQSGSSASNNMNIAFSCLADVTSLLRIRDDNDFESILSKEVVSDSSTLLRILGTFSIHSDNDVQQPSTTLTNGISATSEVTSTIRLFVGSAPVDYEEQTNGAADTSMGLVGPSFRSTVFQQECKHFCTSQKCYRAPWVIKHIKSTLSVCCTSDLDGMIPSNQLRNCFILNWSRQATPSLVKWTRDIHDAGNNCPGQLRLSIPFIFLAANRNVRALVSLLDSHIETFMKVRSTLHNLSSFK